MTLPFAREYHVFSLKVSLRSTGNSYINYTIKVSSIMELLDKIFYPFTVPPNFHLVGKQRTCLEIGYFFTALFSE